MEPIIQLENVNLWYDKGKPIEVHALKEVNIEINKGEYVAFFGPSGCGKTTLLYTISGMDQAQEGRVLINGRDISKFSRQELAVFRQIGVGIVFQQFNLIPSLTVLNNVALPMAFLGISEEKRKVEAMKLLERLNIQHLADRYPFELSGGQQQRVGIARALANNPPIIIADEPLGNLDSANAQNVLEFLKELNEKDGRTIIMVTHEAWSLRDAKKIFYMKDGAILKTENAKPKTVAQSVSKHLYEQLSSGQPPSEITAQTLASLLLRGYSIDEVKRFQFFLKQRLENKIDKETFKAVLDRPYKEGGIGLWLQKARKISNYIEEVMEKKKEIDDVYKELEKNPAMPLNSEVEKIRGWLLEDFHGKITEIQQVRLDELIIEALKSIISVDDFEKTLNLSRNQFGIGMSYRSSQKIMEKLSMILKNNQNNLQLN